ncbi:MAG: methyltransferase domain-containing protein [Rhodoferax sp.]|nr:methyltransferase domain-containing protein [Rhodoferax sp.]
MNKLNCAFEPSGAALVGHQRNRGLVLLTPHFDSFFLGVAFLARNGAKVNLMSSAVTQQPGVDAAVTRHFSSKYRGLENYLNGGRVLDMETGLRQFYRLLERGETLVVLGIQSNPGRWWGADLLVNLPPVVEIQAAAAAAEHSQMPHTNGNQPLPTCEVVFFVDSVLQGTEELAFGIDALKAQLSSPNATSPNIHEVTRLSAPSPAAFLAGSSAAQVLVVLDPAVVAVADLRQQLGASLMRSGATCVVSAGRSDATGEWTIDYCTRSELERYVDRRQALPEHAPYQSTDPKLYLLNTELARNFVSLHPHCAWADLPRALGAACQLAPRAFVHSYGDYQMSSRLEMLAMLPDSVRRLLDIGGGEGGFARAFAARPGAQACLLEPGAIAAQRARASGVTVFERRVEALDPAEVGLFDAVTFLDVLEHLENPIDALRQVRLVLRQGGYVLVSVPNVGFWPIVRELMIGRFDYLPVGILCNTHLRFFTERSLLALLNEAGFCRRAGPSPGSARSDVDARAIGCTQRAGLSNRLAEP